MRKNGLGDTQHAENIGFELAAPVVHAEILDGSGEVDACVVNEDVDGPSSRKRLGNGLADGIIVADVELERRNREFFFAREGIELLQLFCRAASRENLIATLR